MNILRFKVKKLSFKRILVIRRLIASRFHYKNSRFSLDPKKFYNSIIFYWICNSDIKI